MDKIKLWKPYNGIKIMGDKSSLIWDSERFEPYYWSMDIDVVVFYDDVENNNYWFVQYDAINNIVIDTSDLFVMDKNEFKRFINFGIKNYVLERKERKEILWEIKNKIIEKGTKFLVTKIFCKKDSEWGIGAKPIYINNNFKN